MVGCPSSADYNIKDSVWIVGCIDNTTPPKFYPNKYNIGQSQP